MSKVKIDDFEFSANNNYAHIVVPSGWVIENIIEIDNRIEISLRNVNCLKDPLLNKK